MIGHLHGKSLQLEHALRLQVLNRIVKRPVLRLRCGPGHQDVLQHLEYKMGLPIKSGSGEGHQQLKNSFPDKGVLTWSAS